METWSDKLDRTAAQYRTNVLKAQAARHKIVVIDPPKAPTPAKKVVRNTKK